MTIYTYIRIIKFTYNNLPIFEEKQYPIHKKKKKKKKKKNYVYKYTHTTSTYKNIALILLEKNNIPSIHKKT